MKHLLCKLFGHKPPIYAEHKGFGGHEYAKIRGGYRDGVDRLHGHVVGNCARCDAEFVIARVHIPRYNENGDRVKT